MYVKNAKNIVKKILYRRESSKETNRELKCVDRKFRRTNLRNEKNNTIHAILNILIKD